MPSSKNRSNAVFCRGIGVCFGTSPRAVIARANAARFFVPALDALAARWPATGTRAAPTGPPITAPAPAPAARFIIFLEASSPPPSEPIRRKTFAPKLPSDTALIASNSSGVKPLIFFEPRAFHRDLISFLNPASTPACATWAFSIAVSITSLFRNRDQIARASLSVPPTLLAPPSTKESTISTPIAPSLASARSAEPAALPNCFRTIASCERLGVVPFVSASTSAMRDIFGDKIGSAPSPTSYARYLRIRDKAVSTNLS